MDPVEFRRLNAVDTGVEGPSGQTYGEIGVQQCIEEATKLVGYGRALPDDEAIGVAIGWWPSFAVPSGAYIKIDGDGSGQIITGAQECGTGSVMTLRQLAAEELGMEPEDFQLIYQDTSVAPYDMGATGSQTLFNNGRAVVAAAGQIAEQLKALAAEHLEASPADIVLADGHAHVAGTPSSTVSIAELAGIAAGGELLIAHGSGTPPSAPPLAGSSCVGDVGMASFVAPQFSCHAVRIRLDRDTGVVRVLEVGAAHDSGTIINETGALGQIQGGVMMGIGQALTEGTLVRRQVAPTQRGLVGVQAADLRRLPGRSTPTSCRSTRPTPVHAARRAWPRRPTWPPRRRSPTRLAKLLGRPGSPPADDGRAGLGDDGGGRSLMNFTIASTLDEALAAVAAGARPIAGGSDLVVGARHGKAPMPDSVVAIDRIDSLGHIETSADGVRIGALVTHARLEIDDRRSSAGTPALADASALVGSPSTRNVGTIGGNVMNASPAMDTGAPLVVFGAEVELQSTTGSRRVPVADLWTGPGRTSAHAERAVRRGSPSRPTGRCRAAHTCASSTAGRWRSPSSALRRRCDSTQTAALACAVGRPHRRRPDDHRRRRNRRVARPSGRRRVCSPRSPRWPASRPSPISDLRASDRYRRHCVGVMARRAVDAAARRARGESIAVPVNRSLGIGAAS